MPEQPHPYDPLTSDNTALVLVDHQVGLMTGVRDYSTGELKHNVVALAKAAKALKLPIVATTTARDSLWGPTFPELVEALPGVEIIDRSSVNAFDDERKAADSKKALAVAGIKGVFIDRDPTVFDRLFSADYRQHNPQIPNGTAAIKALLGKLPADFKYEPGLVVAEGDYVTIHGRYFGWGPKPMIAVDIFRVANGKIAEHWDVMQEEVPAAQSANGNSMLTSTQGSV
jgi:predicted SnoaL-like aldol condensation-catalyzing enzyme